MNNQVQNSKSTEETNWLSAIKASETRFKSSGLVFDEEEVFAIGAFNENQFLMNTAIKNPTSVKLAMFNLASVGLTLNPKLGLAYLIPRKIGKNETNFKTGNDVSLVTHKVTVDISYRGLIALATDPVHGSVSAVKSELVYSNDTFEYRGGFEKPVHVYDPFASPTERGEFRGAYCQALLKNGSMLVETMSSSEIDDVMEISPFSGNEGSVWQSKFKSQMQLKTVTKRSYKWWPKPTAVMGNAMHILNAEFEESKPLSLVDNGKKEISSLVRNSVVKMVKRAESTGGFEACKDYMRERFTIPHEYEYALDQLNSCIKKLPSIPQD